MRQKLTSVHLLHGKPQLYQHRYCLVCMTGLVGCRWHRYQQSTRDSRKRDLTFFAIILLCFLHMVVFFYFWLVSRNNIYQITVDMYLYTNTYFPWNDVGLGASSVMLAYFSGIVILCLCHVQFGHQLYLHPVHLLIIFLLEVLCIVVSVLLDIYWPQSWSLTFFSLWVYSPFLQIVLVLILTAMGWLTIRQWFGLQFVYKIVWLPVMLVVLLALYMFPFWIDSPVVNPVTTIKPGIIAMGGASDIAPENTLYAFRKALNLGVTRIQTSVQISFDGVPFLFLDDTLMRTTDFEELRNHTLSTIPMENTMLELQMLNAGAWFIEHDPFGSAWRLSDNETSEVIAQKIPTLSELLQLGIDYPTLEVYLMVQPLPEWHPFCCDPTGVIDDVISRSEAWFNRSNIYVPAWLYSNVSDSEHFMPADPLREVTTTYMTADSPDLIDKLRKSQKHQVKTVVSDVNSHWLLSVLWCAGTDLIATRHVQHMKDIASLILYMDAGSYIALWATANTLSVIAIIVIFIYHRIKLYGTNFSPEAISLNTARSRMSYKSRTMKEKLLRESTVAEFMGELEARDNDGMDSRPAFSLSAHQAYSLSSFTQTVTDTGGDLDVNIVTEEPGHSLPTSTTNRYSV